MEAGLIISIIVAIAAIATLVINWQKSSREKRKEDETTGEFRQKLQDDISFVRKSIADPNTGLQAISDKFNNHIIHCHESHAELNQKYIHMQEEIKELKDCSRCWNEGNHK